MATRRVTQLDSCRRIQTVFRKRACQLRYKKNLDCVLKIQSVIRIIQVKQCMRLRGEMAMKIQALWRMALSRLRYKQTQHSLLRLQSLARQRAAMALFSRHKSTICIQSWYRSSSSRLSFLAKKEAAKSIQTVLRGHWEKIALHSKKCAAILLQAKIRAWLVRRTFESLPKAAIAIVKHWRDFAHQKKLIAKKKFVATKL